MDWIKTTIKTPELTQVFGETGRNSERVLVCDKDSRVYFAAYVVENKIDSRGDPYVLKFWSTVEMAGHRHLDVMHWMPIPKTPAIF